MDIRQERFLNNETANPAADARDAQPVASVRTE